MPPIRRRKERFAERSNAARARAGARNRFRIMKLFRIRRAKFVRTAPPSVSRSHASVASICAALSRLKRREHEAERAPSLLLAVGATVVAV